MASLVETMKAEDRFFEAGQAAFAVDPSHRSYGCHFGMRSSRDHAMREFYRGFDEAAAKFSQKGVAFNSEMGYGKNMMMKGNEMTKITKTSVTLGVMTANGDKPMADVVPMILEAQHAAGFTDVTLKICEGAYRWAVRNAVAPGVVPEKAPKVKVAKVKTVKTKAEAVKKIAKKASSKDLKPVETKSPEEIERIREANLARMKEVASRQKKNNDEMEVVPESIDRDTFVDPPFLTREEVNALI